MIVGEKNVDKIFIIHLRDILRKFKVELGSNFTGLENVFIDSFKDIDNEAYYHYCPDIKDGDLFINSDRFQLCDNCVINENKILYFEHTVTHEIGHHLYYIHDLKNRVRKFYNDNEEYIKKYIEWGKYKNNFKTEDDFMEFFANYFCRFRFGELNYLKEKIYHFIFDIYESLKESKMGTEETIRISTLEEMHEIIRMHKEGTLDESKHKLSGTNMCDICHRRTGPESCKTYPDGIPEDVYYGHKDDSCFAVE